MTRRLTDRQRDLAALETAEHALDVALTAEHTGQGTRADTDKAAREVARLRMRLAHAAPGGRYITIL